MEKLNGVAFSAPLVAFSAPLASSLHGLGMCGVFQHQSFSPVARTILDTRCERNKCEEKRQRKGKLSANICDSLCGDMKKSRSHMSRRCSVCSVIFGVCFFGQRSAIAVGGEDEEENEERDSLLKSKCGQDCLGKCFTNFGAALVPGNKADVEVYCKSRCVYMCDVDDEDGAARPLSQTADPLNALSGRRRSGKFCTEGKKATAAVQTGVYDGRGLEFYDCR